VSVASAAATGAARDTDVPTRQSASEKQIGQLRGFKNRAITARSGRLSARLCSKDVVYDA
jgi:hypothetical protein